MFTGDPLYHVLSGGLYWAVFMATDYVTCPVTKTGAAIYALRFIDGVIQAIRQYARRRIVCNTLMNVVTPLIDRHTIPASFGGERNVDSIIKPALVLFLVCAVTTGALAVVNRATVDVIEQRTNAEQEEFRKQVLDNADSFKQIELDPGTRLLRMYMPGTGMESLKDM